VLGSPPSNLSPSQTQLEYNIVIGSSNQHADSLKAEMKSNPNQINLHQGLSQEEMFQMVSGSSLAIGSIGVSMYERICIGTPTIIITIAENQQAIAQELSQANLVDDLGFGLNFDVIKLQQILMCYYQNPKLLIKRREECQQTCDGRGISRIIKVMEDYIKISNSELKTGCVIQARMTSTRLPGKVLMPIYQEMSMLEVVLRRLKKSQYLDEIIVATTINQTDDPIINLCQNKLKSLNIRTFRGSEQNVLERYYQASKQYKLNTIIRITSDCPLIDPHVLDSMIQFYRQNSLEYDYVSNVINRTYPRGLDTEIFSFQALERAYQTAETQPELEHVTTKILRSPEYSRYAYIQEQNYSDYRLTVDTPEDIELIKEIYSNINKIDFIDITQEEVIVFLSENPKLLEINQDIRQKEVK
jgi:spore coat polysaccharide biosynthesis protein SpsF